MGRDAELLNAALTVIIKYWFEVDIISLLILIICLVKYVIYVRAKLS